MISARYDEENRCVYLNEADEYIGTLYGVYSTEIKDVGRNKKATFKNAEGIPILVLFCEYSGCDVITSRNG
jgi:hypothetical protein